MTNYCLRNYGSEEHPEWHCDPTNLDLPGARDACDFKTGNRDPKVSSGEATLMKDAHCPYRGPENDCIKIQGKTSKGKPRLTQGSDDYWHDQNKVRFYIDRDGKRIPDTHPNLRDRDVMCEGSTRSDRRKRSSRSRSYSVGGHVAYKDMDPAEIDDLLRDYGETLYRDETDRERLRRLVEVAEGSSRRTRRRVNDDRSHVSRDSDYSDTRSRRSSDSNYSAGFEAGLRAAGVDAGSLSVNDHMSDRDIEYETDQAMRRAEMAVDDIKDKYDELLRKKRSQGNFSDPGIDIELRTLDELGKEAIKNYRLTAEAAKRKPIGIQDGEKSERMQRAKEYSALARENAAQADAALARARADRNSGDTASLATWTSGR